MDLFMIALRGKKKIGLLLPSTSNAYQTSKRCHLEQHGFARKWGFAYNSTSSQGKMSQKPPSEITQMLIELTGGNRDVVNQILPHIYDELRRLAGSYLRRERADHTLQPTALVHEAYMKLIDQKQVHWQNRAHFFGIAAQVMRRILMDHARKHTAEKRGGEAEKLPLEEEILIVSHDRSADLIALDDALDNLAKLDEQKAKIVELRYFGGLSIEETAEVMGVSVPTINRQWRMAKAWLHAELQTT